MDRDFHTNINHTAAIDRVHTEYVAALDVDPGRDRSDFDSDSLRDL